MRYKILEMMLNEYVNHPTEKELAVVEAATYQEAEKIAQIRFPNRQVKIACASQESNSKIILG